MIGQGFLYEFRHLQQRRLRNGAGLSRNQQVQRRQLPLGLGRIECNCLGRVGNIFRRLRPDFSPARNIGSLLEVIQPYFIGSPGGRVLRF